MSLTPSTLSRLPVAGLLLALVATASEAHTGHGTSGFYQGILHPFGLDHLLAMVAVGIWSVSALPGNKVWQGPAIFMISLLAGATAGVLGASLPDLEHAISLSVVLFGAMVFAARPGLPAQPGLALIAIAASLHGLAHGAETPESGFAVYAAGFLLTTAALHAGGVLAGLGIKRHVPNRALPINASLGAIFSGAGIYLLNQI